MIRQVGILCVGYVLAACGGTHEGEVRITAYGESFIEDGIPAEEMGDAWAVRFDRFVVTVDNVSVGGVTARPTEPIDLSASSGGRGHLLTTVRVPVGAHTEGRYTIARIDLTGSATKDGVTKTFSWSFDQPTAYTRCETTTVVNDRDAATFEVTVHADHLFYDSLVSEEPQVLFQRIADADVDLDGEVSSEELQAAGIGPYDPGNADIADLWDWLKAQYQTVGHVDGEGHCDVRSSA